MQKDKTQYRSLRELSQQEIAGVSGAKGWGWLGAVEPIWDFGKGVIQGFGDALKRDK